MACPCEHKAKGGKSCKAGTPPVIKVESVECPVLFHTVNIPASVGTVETLPPTPGAYRNARVTYEADEVSYLYDSDGIPQLLSNGGSSAVESVNGKVGVVVLDANDVGAQPTLIAGANVQITDNTISATDTTYTAGSNITIDANNEISATDTTYSDFVGTDGVDAGTAGLVPAPATTDAGKFLKADGTWSDIDGTTETYTIADTDWVALSDASPYTYSADVTATATIGANTICELFNDDAVTFATYGFAIGAVNSQTVTIYSVGAPASPVTLKINYKG